MHHRTHKFRCSYKKNKRWHLQNKNNKNVNEGDDDSEESDDMEKPNDSLKVTNNFTECHEGLNHKMNLLEK